MKIAKACLALALLAGASSPGAPVQAPSASKNAVDVQDSYKEWLARDVVYIITPEEEAVFRKLTADEERSAFVEQFWERRNPKPGSSINEFKIEHYRRIAYANERFTSGYDGWKTDRGRIYIMYGEPYHIEDHPGGRYDRPMHEGGGTTSAFPFQIWRYRYLPGIGSDVEIEFVDTSETGDYRIARDADEKDALLTMPGQGLTLDERAGAITRGDRIDNRFVSNPNYFKYMREQDTPFARLYLKAKLDAPPLIQNEKLREAVAAKVTFESQFPFRTSIHHVKLSDTQALVLANIEVRNDDISYSAPALGMRKGVIEIYGKVTSLSGRYVTEFEDTIYSESSEDQFEAHKKRSSIYQKGLTLGPGIYKLDLVLKNRVSDTMGFAAIRIGVPNLLSQETLSFGSLILCRGLVPLGDYPDQAGMFVLGDVKVIPSLDHQFAKNTLVGIYTQVYNCDVDQSSLQPALSVHYQLLRGETVLKNFNDEQGQTIHFASGQRVVLTNTLPTGDLEPGDYQLRVAVEDRLSRRRGELRTTFRVLS